VKLCTPAVLGSFPFLFYFHAPVKGWESSKGFVPSRHVEVAAVSTGLAMHCRPTQSTSLTAAVRDLVLSRCIKTGIIVLQVQMDWPHRPATLCLLDVQTGLGNGQVASISRHTIPRLQ